MYKKWVVVAPILAPKSCLSFSEQTKQTQKNPLKLAVLEGFYL